MKIRLHGTKEECKFTATVLTQVSWLRVVSVSEPYPDRGASVLVRVYVEARLDDQPGSVHATATAGRPDERAPDVAQSAPRRRRRALPPAEG
jgi:hypothetical protein